MQSATIEEPMQTANHTFAPNNITSPPETKKKRSFGCSSMAANSPNNNKRSLCPDLVEDNIKRARRSGAPSPTTPSTSSPPKCYVDSQSQTDLTLLEELPVPPPLGFSPQKRPLNTGLLVDHLGASFASSSASTSTSISEIEPVIMSQPQPSRILNRAESTVSVSHVTNVSVNRRLISFSSICSVDVAEERRRPLLRHTRTAALDKSDEHSRDEPRPPSVMSTTSVVKPSRVAVEEPQPMDTQTDIPSSSQLPAPDSPPKRKSSISSRSDSLRNIGKKRSVGFGSVDVFYFKFAQSCDTVPTLGGVPLGMEQTHHDREHYSCRDHQRMRRLELKYSLDSASTSRTKRITKNSAAKTRRNLNPKVIVTNSASADEIHSANFVAESVNSDEEISAFPQALDKRTRSDRVKTHGITLDKSISDECSRISTSRQLCGCTCRNGICNPLTCQCAIDGVQCLIDRPSFPCSCSATLCANPCGRWEFDSAKVRTHIQSTVKEFKRLQQRCDDIPAKAHLTQSFDKLTVTPMDESADKPTSSQLSVSAPLPQIPQTPLKTKITTQFSSGLSIESPDPVRMPERTPLNVTRRRKYVPRLQMELAASSPDLSAAPVRMDVDFSAVIGGIAERPQRAEVCEVFVTSPADSTDAAASSPSSLQSSSLLFTSRSLSAATTTTDDNSRTNSTELNNPTDEISMMAPIMADSQ